MPEGHSARGPGRRGDQHSIVGDLLDPPTARTQGDHFAGAGFVDHLLVEFAYPRHSFGGHMDPEQPSIGDRAGVGDGQALGSGSGGEDVGLPIPHQPWTQLGEPIRWVATRKHGQHRVQQRLGQRCERRGTTHQRQQIPAGVFVHRAHCYELLGQDVER